MKYRQKNPWSVGRLYMECAIPQSEGKPLSSTYEIVEYTKGHLLDDMERIEREHIEWVDQMWGWVWG